MALSFNYQVSLGQSLSSNGVAYLTGPVDSSILFNDAPVALTGILESLNSNGSTFKIDRAYNTSLFSLILSDRTSTIFTVATATATQTLTDNGFNSVGPRIRQLVNLGYL
jgi:hypothetical protein